MMLMKNSLTFVLLPALFVPATAIAHKDDFVEFGEEGE